MSFTRQSMTKARRELSRDLPRVLRQELDRAAARLGPYGVRVARALVAQNTGRTFRNITYETEVTRGRGGGWNYRLIVFVRADTRQAALAVFVTEFGRGHGRAGHAARGSLPPRPFLRPSRELVAKRARGAFSRAMRTAAQRTIGR